MRAAEVPPEMLAVFERARETVQGYFADLATVPARGRVEVSKDRFILARTDSLSRVLRSVLADIYGERGSDQLLYSFGRAVGRREAQSFFERFQLTEPMERFGFGPTYFSFSGWAFVNLLYPSHPVASEEFLLVFSIQNSFEAEGYVASRQMTDKPICHINAGYLTGWCEESFSIPLETRELFCSARGEGFDLFLMTHRKRILQANENALRLIGRNEDLTAEAILAG